MWTGNVSPIMRQKKKGSRPMRNARRRASRRLVLPGFPILPRKFSREEINNYFSGDKLQCLLCGKIYKDIGKHLRIHDLNIDDYKELYGLPWRKGLVCQETHNCYSRALKKRTEDNPSFYDHVKRYRKDPAFEAKLLRAIKNQRFQPFRKEVAQDNISHTASHMGKTQSHAYEPKFFWKIANKMFTGITLTEAIKESGIPGRSWFHKHLRENPKDRKKFIDEINKLPFKLQGKLHYGMGTRFINEVKKLRKQNKSDHEMAKILGVTAMTINRNRFKHKIK